MRGMVPSTKLLEADELKPPTFIARALGLDDDATAFYLRRLRYADDAPMSLEESWLPAALLPGFITPTPPESIYGELQTRGFRPTWGEDTIESVNVDIALAQLLEVEPGAAGIHVTRRTFAEAVPVDFTVSIYRGDRYKLWVPISQPLSPIYPHQAQRY